MFREPTLEEKSKLIIKSGSRVEIFWDGDYVFYPAVVVKYDVAGGKHTVVYDNDDTGEEYSEDLKTTLFRIWDESLGSGKVNNKSNVFF